jgi:predicted Rdx family selenoprotein
VKGAKSQFDVVVHGRTIFSKQRDGRYPQAAEVLESLVSST